MDHRRFDTALRALDAAVSRRRGLAAAVAVFLGASVQPGEDAGAAPRSPRPAGPCGNGSRAQNTCRRNGDCCTGLCDRRPAKRNNDGAGRCRCVRKGRPCTDDRNCCRGLDCRSGTCGGPRPQVNTGEACTAADQCRDENATCTTFETGPAGTFCLLPRYDVCTAAQQCAAGACIDGSCGSLRPTPGMRCTTTDDCGEGMSCAAGLCFDISPCPAAFCSGMWCTFTVSQDDENEGNGGATGKVTNPNRLAMLPDKSAFLSVEANHNRIQKFDAHTFEWLGSMSAPTDSNATPVSGSGDGEFDQPKDIVVRPDGTEAYVVDSGNSRITVVDPAAWTVLRQIPITSDAIASGFSLNGFNAAAFDSAGDRLLLLLSGGPQSSFAIIPIDGSTQSSAPVSNSIEFTNFVMSADSSRVYLIGDRMAYIFDGQFQEIAGATYGTAGQSDCQNGFAGFGFHAGSMGIDDNGNVWIEDRTCRRWYQFNVTGDSWSPVTWLGFLDSFTGISPMFRSDGTMLLLNRASRNNVMTVRCRNPLMPDGTRWRSGQLSHGRASLDRPRSR
jgi:YVTN family beta-propeller protein